MGLNDVSKKSDTKVTLQLCTCICTIFAKDVSTAGDIEVRSLLTKALVAVNPIHVASAFPALLLGKVEWEDILHCTEMGREEGRNE